MDENKATRHEYNYDVLPNELVLLILSFLDDTTLCTCSMANKHFQFLTNFLFKERCLKDPMYNLFSNFPNCHLNYKQRIFYLKKYPSCFIVNGTNTLEYKHNSSLLCTFFANHPYIAKKHGTVFYFEMKLLEGFSEYHESELGIGIVERGFPNYEFVGWRPTQLKRTFAYHGDDGQLRYCDRRWLDVNLTTVYYKKGDVVGLCVDFGKDEIFVTKNGQTTDRKRNNIPNMPWFAAFSTSVPSHVELNFGASPFVFPLKEYVDERDTIKEYCWYEDDEEDEEEDEEEDLFEPYSEDTESDEE